MRADKLIDIPMLLHVPRDISTGDLQLPAGYYVGAIRTEGTTTGDGISWKGPTCWITDRVAKIHADVTDLVRTGQVVISAKA